jgi:hypothetical protein
MVFLPRLPLAQTWACGRVLPLPPWSSHHSEQWSFGISGAKQAQQDQENLNFEQEGNAIKANE